MRGKMLTGLDRIRNEKRLQELVRGRIGYLCHSASVGRDLNHGLDILVGLFGDRITCAFGPQHGFSTDLQDNMIESPDLHHPIFGIPLFSLYGDTRAPTPGMLDLIDTLVVDLQDVGTRVYTYIWSIFLAMEACSGRKKRVVILDRPNPAGGVLTEGNIPENNWFSFVCRAPIPMRHGLTVGELARIFQRIHQWDLELEVISMEGWNRQMLWNDTGLHWVNPSPNLPTPQGTLVYPGSVMIEGTILSEGRGTTRSLEIIGHPDIEPFQLQPVLTKYLIDHRLTGFYLRPMIFLPTFHKHQHQSCGGFQIHVTDPLTFKPWRTLLHIIKYLADNSFQSAIWNQDPYEYEFHGLAFDWIHGTDKIREWVEERHADDQDLTRIEMRNSEGFRYLAEEMKIYPS